MKYKLAIVFILACLFNSGCSSSPSYTPPEPGTERGYITIYNNCDFTLYVEIDDTDAGSIPRGENRTLEVAPGTRNFQFHGYYEDPFEDVVIPVYFETYREFTTGEDFKMPVKLFVR
ncbi:MAG: hypothetical protein ACLFQV_01805 [Vulcanimicrobiota bacterium]